MTNARLETFRTMVAKNPENVLARFGLANEAAKEGLLDEAVEQYQAYLAVYDDEGNGWARLADVLLRRGQTDDAKVALRNGIAAAQRFGHNGLMADLEEKLDELG